MASGHIWTSRKEKLDTNRFHLYVTNHTDEYQAYISYLPTLQTYRRVPTYQAYPTF